MCCGRCTLQPEGVISCSECLDYLPLFEGDKALYQAVFYPEDEYCAEMELHFSKCSSGPASGRLRAFDVQLPAELLWVQTRSVRSLPVDGLEQDAVISICSLMTMIQK